VLTSPMQYEVDVIRTLLFTSHLFKMKFLAMNIRRRRSIRSLLLQPTGLS